MPCNAWSCVPARQELSCPFDRVIVVYLKLFLQCTNSNNCTSLGRFSNMMAHSAHCKKICNAKFSARSAVSRRVAGLLNNPTARLVHARWFITPGGRSFKQPDSTPRTREMVCKTKHKFSSGKRNFESCTSMLLLLV